MKIEKYDTDLYPFIPRRLKIQGHSIHYIDEGEGDIILFCHPSVSSSFMYRNMIPELSPQFRCIAFDFPGFGLSVADNGYIASIDAQAEVVKAFVEKLQLNKVYLVVQEVGGHAAMKYFLKRPHRLKGLIITDTILFPCSDYPRIRHMLGLVNSRVFTFLNTRFNLLIRAMTRFGINNRKLSAKERNVYKNMFHSPARRSDSTRLLYELVIQEDLLRQIEQALSAVFNALPALIIYGSKDALVDLGIPQRLQGLLPHSELRYIEGESHFPHEGAPEAMAALIREWMWIAQLPAHEHTQKADREPASK